MMFAAGSLVLCVDDTPRWPHETPLAIEQGGEYVVESVGVDEADQLGLHLVGFESIGWRGGYRADRFVSALGPAIPAREVAVVA
ncbi:MAG: hypothetical protein CL804_03515 [Citromicrobium sp.]|nr:hypothetical protein [Citromicrobium sp.]|tara:strand:- start:9397 stop:9648 length:252 start_codon:yes stop_codon:yes gene_type:complete